MNPEELKAQNPYSLHLSSYRIPIGLEAIHHDTWNEGIDFAYKMSWRPVPSEKELSNFLRSVMTLYFFESEIQQCVSQLRQWWLEGGE